jgi:hypothetical protein
VHLDPLFKPDVPIAAWLERIVLDGASTIQAILDDANV